MCRNDKILHVELASWSSWRHNLAQLRLATAVSFRTCFSFSLTNYLPFLYLFFSNITLLLLLFPFYHSSIVTIPIQKVKSRLQAHTYLQLKQACAGHFVANQSIIKRTRSYYAIFYSSFFRFLTGLKEIKYSPRTVIICTR